jgi:hypothetical protein
VTEAEWDARADPQPMLEALRGKASGRKLRLYCCACRRRIAGGRLHRGWDPVIPAILDRAERYADGQATAEELDEARMTAQAPAYDLFDANDASLRRNSSAILFGIFAGFCATLGYRFASDIHRAVLDFYRGFADARARVGAEAELIRADEGSAQAGLLRCIFGNPFRPAPAVDPTWLAWNDANVTKLTAAIYDGRRFADLPILADPLEDAGCADAAILAHCRGGGEHVRGCWVVDLPTGRP